MYQYIVFDLDMTILDTAEANLFAVQEALENLEGKKIARKDLEYIFSNTTDMTMDSLGIRDKVRFLRAWFDGIAKYRHTISFFPGMQELLHDLKNAGYQLGMVTSRTQEEAQTDIRLYGMTDLFRRIIGADDAELPKPNPHPLQKFVKDMQTQEKYVLYVGDTHSDMCCAASADVDFAVAGWGVMGDSEFSKSKYYCEQVEDLRKILL